MKKIYRIEHQFDNRGPWGTIAEININLLRKIADVGVNLPNGYEDKIAGQGKVPSHMLKYATPTFKHLFDLFEKELLLKLLDNGFVIKEIILSQKDIIVGESGLQCGYVKCRVRKERKLSRRIILNKINKCTVCF